MRVINTRIVRVSNDGADDMLCTPHLSTNGELTY